MALIELVGVTKIFGQRPERQLERVWAGASKDGLLAETGHILALREVNLAIEKGEVFVVMGLSGSGKSTLLRHINRLVEPTAGSVRVESVDILRLSRRELVRFRRRRMSMVFQHFALLPHRTVADNVAYGLAVQGIGRRRRRELAAEWIEAVGLTGYERQFPAQLSGGMRQRVGLARALCAGAEILLMDEPFSALDPIIRSQMQDQLMALQARLRKTIVFITHDLDEALKLGDRIAILKDGEVAQVGRPADILLRPADAYVRAFVRDVNRARALTVEAVMEPPALRLTDETLEDALAAMQRSGAEVGYVVVSDRYRGVVTRETLVQAIAGEGGAQRASGIAAATETVTPGSSLAAVLPAALGSSFPVPVIDAEGRLAGVLPRGRLAEALALPVDAGGVKSLASPPSASGAAPSAAATR